MRKLIACLLALPLFWSCQEGYQQTESGLQFKIIQEGSGPVATAGSTIKVHYTQMLHDTVTMTTFGKLPYYRELIPGTIFPYDPFEALTRGVRTGDSVVVIQRMDSLVKKGRLEKLPSHIKPDDVMIIGIRVLQVFPFEISRPAYADSLLKADKEAERGKMDSIQTILGPKRVKEFLSKHSITAAQTELGTYVQVIDPGNGMQADPGKTVLLRFKVSNIHGRVLDSNIDTSVNRKEPLRFTVGSNYMPHSVDRAIRQLKKGGHARVFIPAMVAIGEMPNGDATPSYDDMIFEVIVEDVQ